MTDGSSVRTKVAQYFVNKKLQELETQDPKIKIDQATLKHAFPLLGYVSEDTEHDEPQQQPPQQPPLPSIPATGEDDDVYSWKSMLEILSQATKYDEPQRAQLAQNVPAEQTSFSDEQPDLPPFYRVAIIGAGVAGLRTAKLLQDLGIPYKIFEASERAGGRIFTYEFATKGSTDPQGKHDYYDVGAMRFPDNDANKRTFDLFKELGLSGRLINYVFSNEENIRFYNDRKTTAAVANTAGDHFKDEIVPKEFFDKEYVDLSGKKVYGVNACVAEALDPFRKALIDDFDKGWAELMEYDWASVRSYLTQGKPKYPLSVVHWMENRTSGTGGFDRAFSEEVLESLEFNDPTKDVKWWCLEGGSKFLIDAMLKALVVKPPFNPQVKLPFDVQYEPAYGHRVTSVEEVCLSPHECFPNLPPSPCWPRFPFMKVSVAGKEAEYFTHVISTTTFANLATIDTERVKMTYKQRQAIRTLNYGPAVKVAIKFKTRWWEKDSLKQFGGSSYTDRPSRVVVYPSYGLGEDGPGVLMVTYNWHQDASRFGALIQNPDWSKQLDPDRERSQSEEVLLEQIYKDLSVLHGKDAAQLRADTLDYHAFGWYQNPYTMGAFAYFAPGQFGTLFADIVQPAGQGCFHFAGEVASTHHAWVAGALDSAVRVVDEILRRDWAILLPSFQRDHGLSAVFSDEKSAEAQCFKGMFSKELEEAEFEQM